MASMEDLLDLYAPQRQVVWFDETSSQLLADTRPPLPGKCRRSPWSLWGRRHGTGGRRRASPRALGRDEGPDAVHRLSGNPDPTSRPLVKTTARIQHVHQGRQTEAQGAERTLGSLGPQQVMQDGLLRRSGGATSRSTRPVQPAARRVIQDRWDVEGAALYLGLKVVEAPDPEGGHRPERQRLRPVGRTALSQDQYGD